MNITNELHDFLVLFQIKGEKEMFIYFYSIILDIMLKIVVRI